MDSTLDIRVSDTCAVMADRDNTRANKEKIALLRYCLSL
jgi:hypothetical protein